MNGNGTLLTTMVFYIVIIVLVAVAYWKIWRKAGFSGAWSLLMFVPLVNLGAFLYLGFAEWPIHKRPGAADTFD